MMPEDSEVSSLENEDVQASRPLPKQVEVLGGDFSFRWRPGGDQGGRVGTRAGAEEMTRGDLVVLLRCLSGAQTNDNGWPTLKGKCVEYPKFKKDG
jgi:hypothetical protein